MASQSIKHEKSAGKIDIPRILMYIALLGYTFLSLLPLYYMISSSLMTLGEVNAGLWYPKDIRVGTDISPCILYTTDTFVNDNGDRVTETRFVVDIPEEAAQVQKYGPRSDVRQDDIVRDERFRIPFFTNYCAAWEGANLGTYMWNTFRIVFITLAGLVVFCTMAAYAFARMEFPGKNLLFGIMLATLMVPEMVQQLPNFLLVTEIGNFFGNQGLNLCGAEVRNCWINNWPALTIPFMATPISIFLLRQHFATIPSELWDAARIDGAGHVRFLIQVVIPLSKGVLFVIILFAFIGAWNALAWPILVTSGDSWRPISYGLQSFLNDEGNLGHLRMAGSMITTLPLLILYAFTQRVFVEGISTSGLKG